MNRLNDLNMPENVELWNCLAVKLKVRGKQMNGRTVTVGLVSPCVLMG
jgi:hypothetical protein